MNLTKYQARALAFWASVGFSNSIGGSFKDIDEIVAQMAKEYKFPYKAKYFQKGNKMVFWFTTKQAIELWKVTVGQKAKVAHSVKRELYRAVKINKKV